MTNTSNETTTKGKRGPQGPRETFYVCAGTIEGDDGPELVQDFILVDRDSNEDDMTDQAIEGFTSKHSVEPTSVIGPVFRVRMKQPVQSSRKRQSLRMDLDEIRFTGRRAHAVLNGWSVVAQYIEDSKGTERKDAVWVMFDKETAPGEKKRAKPHPKVVPVNLLENVTDV